MIYTWGCYMPIRMQHGGKQVVVCFSEERRYCCFIRIQQYAASGQTHFVCVFGLQFS